ncbi:MAG TPA: M20/M25/M40 family metallo-hydrolase [Acidimicrobiales bacterium]|nr:M20/M25/M40 family metallo-hydrolase [Acidimicrobiales bacterium]
MTAVAELCDDLRRLVERESPSEDAGATAACADSVCELSSRRLGVEPQAIVVDGRVHLLWQFGAPRVLLLGHLDTVWPTGTIEGWPFALQGDRATGPGAFDMKAGLVQLFEALTLLGDRDGVAVLVTSDEEVGSTTSRQLVEQTAEGLDAVLVLEPSAGGALKTARKGVGSFRIDVLGRAAHAGLEPERGVNATIEVAHQALAAADLADPARGTTVTPTVLTAGTTINTVPDRASLSVDVRATTMAEMRRVQEGLGGLSAVLADARVEVVEVSVRPPLEEAVSADLFDRARFHAERLGFGPLSAVAVGGGSDGNFTAALGVPTLDGLGAVGDQAHAPGEWVSVPEMPRRAALVAALVDELRQRR